MDKTVDHYEHYNTFLVVKCCLYYQCKSKYICTAKGKWLKPVDGASDWLLMSIVPPTLLLAVIGTMYRLPHFSLFARLQ